MRKKKEASFKKLLGNAHFECPSNKCIEKIKRRKRKRRWTSPADAFDERVQGDKRRHFLKNKTKTHTHKKKGEARVTTTTRKLATSEMEFYSGTPSGIPSKIKSQFQFGFDIFF
jgi:hypothetical protein